MPSVLYRKLRSKLHEMEMDQVYLAKKLSLTRVCISNRMCGKVAWRINEMYAIMTLINEPAEKLHEYFPKDGKLGNTGPAPSSKADKTLRTDLICLAHRILLELGEKD